jgi:hypothetical protein
MAKLLDIVTAYLKQDDWPFETLDDSTVVRVHFQGDSAQFTCFAQTREDVDQFVFYSVSPVNVPEHKRPEIAEFITRANYDMVIGNFEMDYGDGEVRFKTSIDVEGTELTPELLKPLLYANVLMMDQYLPGVMSVIYADVSPETAVAQVESDSPEQ